jgi:hypothetical protein
VFKRLKKKLKCHFRRIGLYQVWHFGKQIRNTWKDLKCAAGKGWRRPAGPTKSLISFTQRRERIFYKK